MAAATRSSARTTTANPLDPLPGRVTRRPPGTPGFDTSHGGGFRFCLHPHSPVMQRGSRYHRFTLYGPAIRFPPTCGGRPGTPARPRGPRAVLLLLARLVRRVVPHRPAPRRPAGHRAVASGLRVRVCFRHRTPRGAPTLPRASAPRDVAAIIGGDRHRPRNADSATAGAGTAGTRTANTRRQPGSARALPGHARNGTWLPPNCQASALPSPGRPPSCPRQGQDRLMMRVLSWREYGAWDAGRSGATPRRTDRSDAQPGRLCRPPGPGGALCSVTWAAKTDSPRIRRWSRAAVATLPA
jgi:hypothetical protein